jgi:O-antigen/teichoic acid export membrane protein
VGSARLGDPIAPLETVEAPPGPSALRYYVLMGVAGVLGLAKGLAYSHVLGSTGLGYYALATLTMVYVEPLMTLGLLRGLDAFLPGLYGQERATDAQALRNRVAGATLVSGLAWTLGSSGLALALRGPSLATDVALVGLTTVGTALLSLAMADLRSRLRLDAYGVLTAAKGVLTLAIGVGLAGPLGYRGALVAEIVAALALLAYAASRLCPGFAPRWPGPSLSPVFRMGVPLVLRTLAQDLILYVDRVCVVAAFGAAAFGQYAFAGFLVSGGMVLHTAIWAHVGPRAAFANGQRADPPAMLAALHRVVGAVLLVGALGWLPFRAAVKVLVPRFFPDFVTGGELMAILYFGMVLQVALQYEWVAMTLGRARVLLAATVVAVGLTVVAYAVAVSQHWPMAAFAWIFVAGRGATLLAQLAAAHVAVRRAVPA